MGIRPERTFVVEWAIARMTHRTTIENEDLPVNQAEHHPEEGMAGDKGPVDLDRDDMPALQESDCPSRA